MKIYLAGKMAGIPYFNKPKFDAYAKYLRAQGHTVFNPIENDEARTGVNFFSECSTGSHDEVAHLNLSYRTCLKDDLTWICDNAEAIALIPGWENSTGVKAELALAKCLKLEEIYLD
jgi:hypothetical protein